MRINIPFLPEFEEAMLEGRKTSTSRTKRFGNVNDTFKAFGAYFRITSVSEASLDVVAYEYYQDEGFNTPDAFIECWTKIHPQKGFVPDQLVHFHSFKKI